MYWYFLFVPLSLSLFLSVSCFMAPKQKSTSSRNPLRFGASSSSPSINSTLSHIRFHDDKACKDFLENFSCRGIHSERQVILLDFSNSNIPIVRGWESLCGISVTYPSVIIQEFYSNMHGFNYLYLILSLTFEVRALQLLRILYPRCYTYQGQSLLTTLAMNVLGLCPKMNSCLTSVRHIHLGLTVKTPLTRALQKVRGSLTW